MNIRLRKIALCGVITSFALIAFILEGLLPPLFLPGARLGLSNAFILLVALLCGWQYAFASLIIKIVLGSIFAGNISSIMYSLPAGLFSLTLQIILIFVLNRFSIVSVSVFGAVVNSTIQNLVFCLVTGSLEYLYYLPYLALISVFSGALVGFIVYLTIKKLPEKFFRVKNKI